MPGRRELENRTVHVCRSLAVQRWRRRPLPNISIVHSTNLTKPLQGRVAIGAKTVYNLPALELIDCDEAPKAVEDDVTSFKLSE